MSQLSIKDFYKRYLSSYTKRAYFWLGKMEKERENKNHKKKEKKKNEKRKLKGRFPKILELRNLLRRTCSRVSVNQGTLQTPAWKDGLSD